MNSIPMLALATAAGLALAADPLAPRPNGPMPAPPGLHLIDNATVYTAPGAEPRVMDILIDDGRIVRVAESIDPGAARVWDAQGLHVYAGFIDAYVPVSVPQVNTTSPGAHWSPLVGPHRDAMGGNGLPASDAESLRKLGFTAAHIAPDAGIFRGWGAVVSTAEAMPDPALGRPPVYRAKAAQHLAFERARGDYPNSHMGIVALMRQTFIDAEHRARAESRADANILDHIDPDAAFFYDSSFELEALLADKVAREFGHERVAIIGSGNEFKRLDALADAGRSMVVPLIMPNTPDVWSVGAADSVTLETLMEWEQAPANPRWLAEKGLPVSLTASKLPRNQNFHTNLRRSVDAGLTPDQALAMLTTNPAELLGLADELGAIEPGKRANLVITSAPLFHGSDTRADDRAQILSVWIDGRHHKINDRKDTRFNGEWMISGFAHRVEPVFELEMDPIRGDETPEELRERKVKFTATVEVPTRGISADLRMKIDGNTIRTTQGRDESNARRVSIKENRVSFVVDDVRPGMGSHVLSGVLGSDGVIRGTAIGPDQSVRQWTARRYGTPEDKPERPIPSDDFPVAEQDKDADQPAEDRPARDRRARAQEPRQPPSMPAGAPFGAYTVDRYPEPGTYLLTNATVWTQSDQGVLEDAYVLVREGKIIQIGTGGVPEIDATIIDCAGMHITPGLIDAHSHTGLFRLGVNESGQAVTSEVRIADSIDPGHINWYRQLAGGVTTAMLLHGSANPIGGQSQTVKVRWGALRAEDMHFEDAKPGIKFALGENVKQSNWGDRNTTRYPQTRLGVETLLRDRFTKAREYGIARGMLSADATPSRTGAFLTATPPPASRPRPAADPADLSRDLELEILAEILAGERLVHCHSYRQDEILMLCRVAEDFGFTIGTFQHGLETYKVAEIVRDHAVGASLFSDWWAFKVEVQDAIPWAGPINFEVGLNTSFNSDSDELARRMHVEAAKAYKYAREAGIEMSRQDALDFVTRNPAIQLGIIDRVGTIEPGKDADLVVWSGDPLSSMTRAVRTFVDGRQLFSPDIDQAHRERIRAERTRLIEKIMAEGRRTPSRNDRDNDTREETESESDEPPTRRALLARAYERALQQHIEHGPQPGDCGCDILSLEMLGVLD